MLSKARNKSLLHRWVLAGMFSLGMLLSSCQTPTEGGRGEVAPPAPVVSTALPVSAPGMIACCSYWTADEKGNPVLCWSETTGEEAPYTLCFATYDAVTGMFREVRKVLPSTGQKAHGESMAKVGFRGNGDVVAVYRRSTPTPENRFAGSVYTSVSQDRGLTWTEEVKLVQDPSSQSQSFYDLCRLPNGELGMVWLDGRRVEPEKDGSTLFYAQTGYDGQFTDEKPINGATCQCCRTDLYLDAKGLLHVAFRDILNDSIRDMVHLVSRDEGQSFTETGLVSPDNWVINGCPHTGPSLAWNDAGLGCAWYTQGGQRGVYFGLQENEVFGEREMVSAEGAHPQMVSFAENQFAIVCEEFIQEDSTSFNQVALFLRERGREFESLSLSAEGVNAQFATVFQLSERELLVAWTAGEPGATQLMSCRVTFPGAALAVS